MNDGHVIRAARRGLAVALALAVAGLSSATVYAESSNPLRVMTQNLYLGADLAPAIAAAGDPNAFIDAVGQIYQTVLETDFPARAEAIADSIEDEQPDVIGLQEVTTWTAVKFLGPPSLLLSQDFLTFLQQDLRDRGLHYEVVSESNNATITAPLRAASAGCAVEVADPLQFNCFISLHDRDVILVNLDTNGLTTSNPTHGNYAVQFPVTVLGQPQSFNRGWAAVDVGYRGETVRVVNTHLEVAAIPPVQVAQAQELIRGPLSTNLPVIAIGDFNSAADGSGTATYQLLVNAGLTDAWSNRGGPGYTCCQNDTLTNTQSTLRERIDLILSRRTGRAVPHLVNNEPFQGDQPLWPSDHAGVAATIKLS
jgi:endonuclease/exonuclease/phosphatase family metal-dependent hydrolase